MSIKTTKKALNFAALLLMLAVMALTAGRALAHAKLVSSTPAEGATIAVGTTQLVLNFSEEISIDQSSATLAGSSGAAMSGVQSAVDRDVRTKMTIQTSPLEAGSYTISWAAVTEDDNGHSNGTINFTVSNAANGSASLPQTGSGDDSMLATMLLVCALCAVALGTGLRRHATLT